MQNLLLHARYLADEFESDLITIEHIQEAIKTMDLGKKQIKEDILSYMHSNHNENIFDFENQLRCGDKLVDEVIIYQAQELDEINFDDEVKEFISSMKEKGYSVEGDEVPSSSYVEGYDILLEAKSMKARLSNKLYGQDRAIESVTDSIKNNILANKNEPKSTYLFLGPPATGKTYLAELIGENLNDYKIKKFDMTQYSHSESGGNLYGTSRMWGNAKPGLLTSFVRKNPKSIIVLDEFEKANNQVQTNLLSIFEGGFMQDACGWCKETGKAYYEGNDDENKCPEFDIDDNVDFRQTIFIITSNLGKELYADNKFIDLIEDDYIQAESMILDALKREEKQDNKNGGEQPAIVPELISRFSKANIVLFDKLNYQAYATMATKSFDEYKDQFTTKYGIEFHKNNNFKNFLKTQVLGFAPELDARRIKSKIGVSFFDRVTDYLMSLDVGINYCKEIKVSISKEASAFIKKHIDDKIDQDKLVKELFRKNLTLKTQDKFTSNNGVITYKIESCKFDKVTRIQDFSEDGLVFDIPEETFKDISGHKKAKQRLQEVINFLKDPSLLESFDIQAPKGMLLYGAPGTGKTMLAKAFANEADLPFIKTTGSDLLNTDTIKEIFTKAKRYAPSIVFIDEIDGLGKRGPNSGREIPINKLLSEMDGFSSKPDEHVFVIAATNYKENIDRAILRAGRIELHIEIDTLDKESRKFFLDKIIKSKPTTGKFDMNKLLMYTTGMSGAQLNLMAKEASIYCIRNNIKEITQDILIEQINTIKYGEKLSHLSLEQMLEETAIHEAGHAIISKVLMPHIKIEQITVTPRGNALGFVSYNYEDMQNNMTIKDYKDRICVSLAGRTAQIKKYGKIDGTDTGAANDLQQATKDAFVAIAHFGMDEDVGYINIDGIRNKQQQTTGITDTKHYQEDIDKALKKWMSEAKENTQNLVEQHWDKIEQLSQLLLKQEVVYESELDTLLK